MMTTILRKSDSPRELRRKIEEASSRRKKFDARRFCGKVRFKVDALAIQKKLHGEWDERSR